MNGLPVKGKWNVDVFVITITLWFQIKTKCPAFYHNWLRVHFLLLICIVKTDILTDAVLLIFLFFDFRSLFRYKVGYFRRNCFFSFDQWAHSIYMNKLGNTTLYELCLLKVRVNQISFILSNTLSSDQIVVLESLLNISCEFVNLDDFTCFTTLDLLHPGNHFYQSLFVSFLASINPFGFFK